MSFSAEAIFPLKKEQCRISRAAAFVSTLAFGGNRGPGMHAERRDNARPGRAGTAAPGGTDRAAGRKYYAGAGGQPNVPAARREEHGKQP